MLMGVMNKAHIRAVKYTRVYSNQIKVDIAAKLTQKSPVYKFTGLMTGTDKV